jgi:hypothetical protein
MRKIIITISNLRLSLLATGVSLLYEGIFRPLRETPAVSQTVEVFLLAMKNNHKQVVNFPLNAMQTTHPPVSLLHIYMTILG